MKKIVLGRGATKRIVKRGTPIKRDGRQTIKKAERAKKLNYFDIRPAVLRTGWSWNASELCWSCKMSFLVDNQPASARYPVYVPTFPQTQTPPVNNYSDNPRVFVVWRGRWEVVATPPAQYSAGNGINITSDNAIENTGVLNVNGVRVERRFGYANV